jgi:hypothetical protein
MQVNDIISIFQGDQLCLYSVGVYLRVYTAKFVCADVLFSLTCWKFRV